MDLSKIDSLIIESKNFDLDFFGKIKKLDRKNRKILLEIDNIGEKIFFHPHEEITIRFLSGHSIYEFKSTISYYDLIEMTAVIPFPEKLNLITDDRPDRYKYHKKIKILEENEDVSGFITDINESGLGFYSPRAHKKGEVLKLELIQEKYILIIKIMNKKLEKILNKNLYIYGAKILDKTEIFE